MITREWRAWIAENLVLGLERDAIVEILRERGFERASAEEEVAAAAESPYTAAAQRAVRRLAKRDWILANQARLEAMSGVDSGVPRVANPSPEDFFQNFYLTNRPAILTGCIDHWPAMQRWTLGYFAQRCGDPEVEVQAGRDLEANYEIRSASHKRRVRLSALLETLRSDPRTNDFYVTANNGGTNRQALAPLWDDIGPLPGILQPGAEQDGFFWLGPRGTITPWHHDLTNNLLVQIRGRKRVTLASVTQTPLMQNFHHCYSSLAGRAVPDHLPSEQRPKTISCDIEPGEILFIPIGWWHHVEGLELSVSLSFVNFVKNNDFASYYRSYGDL